MPKITALSSYLPELPIPGKDDKETIANLMAWARAAAAGFYEYDQQVQRDTKVGEESTSWEVATYAGDGSATPRTAYTFLTIVPKYVFVLAESGGGDGVACFPVNGSAAVSSRSFNSDNDTALGYIDGQAFKTATAVARLNAAATDYHIIGFS